MMKRVLTTVLAAAVVSATAAAQGFVADVLAGKLVDAKVGQWAWYNLADRAGGARYVVRQAIVGREKVGRRKTAYWLEIEVVPVVGYTSVYKMLLTGPAGDPQNVHKVILKQGIDPPREIPQNPETETDKQEAEKQAEQPKPERTSLGMEDVQTPLGKVRAEHFQVTEGERTMDLWISKDVLPTGIVRMRSPDGELLLRSQGVGGEYGESVLDEGAARGAGVSAPSIEIHVDVEGGGQASSPDGDTP